MMYSIQLILLIIFGTQFSNELLADKQKKSSENTTVIQMNSEELQTGSEASLRGLFVVDENTIWASGSEGTVLRSVNGGQTWTKCVIPGNEKNDFRSIHAWDENRALVFGIAGPDFAYLTADGGKNWKVVYNNTTKGIFFNSLKFANENVGLAVSDPIKGNPFLLKTNDGGNTWKEVDNIPESVEGEANFAASNTCIEFLPSGKAWIITGGSVARVFYSADFGDSWQVSETPLTHGNSSSGIFSVCFINDMEGVIVGGTYDSPSINKKIAAFTKDEGKTWWLADKMPKEYRSCVQLINNENESYFFAMGKTGCDYSVDYGKSWTPVSETGYYTFRAVPEKLKGFAAGAYGKIVKLDFCFKKE